MPTSKRLDVLGLGAVAIDDLIYVDAYPPPDDKARVMGRQRRCGGLTAVALITAARLGGRCAYAGVLGADELSAAALEALRLETVDISAVKLAASARPIYSNIVVDRNRGTRNIFFDEDHVVGANPTIPAAVVRSSRVLFVDHLGVPAMIRAARLARRAGIPVVADFENDSHPRFAELLKLANHLILSRGFAARLTGRSSPDQCVQALAASGPEVVVVTCGAEGCWYWDRGGKALRRQDAFRVEAGDTTGCGDVFHGAYAFGLARDLPLDERLQLAAACAALTARRGGGSRAIPALAAVRRYLRDELTHEAC